MKSIFGKWSKSSESDKRAWFSSRKSSSMSLESFPARKKWNLSFQKRPNSSNNTNQTSLHFAPALTQSTIIFEESVNDNQIHYSNDSNPIEPIEIIKSSIKLEESTKYFDQSSEITLGKSELLLESAPQNEGLTNRKKRNLFTPRLKKLGAFRLNKSGQISPEYFRDTRDSRNLILSERETSVWKSLSHLIPPPPVIHSDHNHHPQIVISQDNSSRSIKESVDSIFKKLLSDPFIHSKIQSSTCTRISKSKISIVKNMKHLPPNLNEPLSMSSNIEVYEQEILSSAAKQSRKKRAWTCDNVSETQATYSSQWSIFSWMGGASLALNALSLPTLVIPSPHYRDTSHDHSQIELSSLGSFDH